VNLRRIPVPREHGAWAVLFASLLLAFSHVRSGPAVVLAVLFVLAFAIQQPLRELAAGRRGWPWVAAYGIPLVLGAGYLVLVHRVTLLIWVALFGVLLTAFDLAARRYHVHRSAGVRIAGAAGLSLVVPGMLCLYHPERAGYAWTLWWMIVVYFVARMPVVRARIHGRLSWPLFAASQAALYASALIFTPVWTLIGIVPQTFVFHRGSMRRAGWTEGLLILAYVACLVGSYHLQTVRL
jgi:hypothetical protein